MTAAGALALDQAAHHPGTTEPAEPRSGGRFPAFALAPLPRVKRIGLGQCTHSAPFQGVHCWGALTETLTNPSILPFKCTQVYPLLNKG